MRTTLTIDDDVAFGLRKAQEKEPAKSFKEIVNEMLRRGLRSKNGSAGSVKAKEFKLITYPLGLRKGLNLDNIEELLDQVEGPNRK
jgi:hypothetical protein